jgi:hypothetical protein
MPTRTFFSMVVHSVRQVVKQVAVKEEVVEKWMVVMENEEKVVSLVVITMSPFRNEGRWVLYIRVNDIRNSGGHCMTSRLWELYLLAKSATHTWEGGITKNFPKNTTSD